MELYQFLEVIQLSGNASSAYTGHSGCVFLLQNRNGTLSCSQGIHGIAHTPSHPHLAHKINVAMFIQFLQSIGMWD